MSPSQQPQGSTIQPKEVYGYPNTHPGPHSGVGIWTTSPFPAIMDGQAQVISQPTCHSTTVLRVSIPSLPWRQPMSERMLDNPSRSRPSHPVDPGGAPGFQTPAQRSRPQKPRYRDLSLLVGARAVARQRGARLKSTSASLLLHRLPPAATAHINLSHQGARLKTWEDLSDPWLTGLIYS